MPNDMMAMNKSAANLIRAEIEAAVGAVARKYGLTHRIYSPTFDPGAGTFRMSAEVKLVQREGGESQEKYDFERNAAAIGLESSQYGQSFWADGLEYRLVRVELSRPIRPIVGRRVRDSKEFLFNVKLVGKLRRDAGLDGATRRFRMAEPMQVSTQDIGTLTVGPDGHFKIGGE